jgi:hypothetical protein
MKEQELREQFKKWWAGKTMFPVQYWAEEAWLAASTPLLERIAQLTQQAGDMEKLYNDTMLERDLLALDAERYQWLRDESLHSEGTPWVVQEEDGHKLPIWGAELDSAIDTALQHKEQTDGNG